MSQRMKAPERRKCLLEIMADIFGHATSQKDFTAELVAKTAGISTVLLYRSVGAEFRSLRAQLPGRHQERDVAMSELRRENAVLRQQAHEAQEQLRTTAVSEVDEAIRMIELLEEENLHLRGEIKRLGKRLEERTHVIVRVPADDQAPITPFPIRQSDHPASDVDGN